MFNHAFLRRTVRFSGHTKFKCAGPGRWEDRSNPRARHEARLLVLSTAKAKRVLHWQPAFVNLKKQQPDAFRVVGDLAGADRIMNEAVFIGTYPGLTPAMLDYMVETIRKFVRSK